MFPTLLKKADRISWREMLAAPGTSHTALVIALTLFSALAFALCNNFAIAALYLLFCLFFLLRLTRSLFAALFYVVPAFLLYALCPFLPGVTEPLMLPVAFLALIVGGAAGGFLFTHFHNPRKHWYLFTLPLVAYALPSLLTGDPLRGLLALLPLLLAAVYAISLSLCLTHNDAVILGIIVLVISLVCAGAITVAVCGLWTASPLAALAEAMRTVVETLLHEARALYLENGLDLGLSDIFIENVAAMMINIAPALFLIITSLVSYLAWRTLLCLLVAFRSVPRLPQRIAAFEVSATAAILFILSYFAAWIANAETATLFGTVAQNLSLVLEPALALIGFHAFLSPQNPRSCLSYLLALGFFFLLFSNPVIALTIAAFYGAVTILGARFFPPHDEKGEQ